MSPGVPFFVSGFVIGLASGIINAIANHLLERRRKKIKWRRELELDRAKQRWELEKERESREGEMKAEEAEREQETLDRAVRSALVEDIPFFEAEERITAWLQTSLVPDHLFYSRLVYALVLVAGVIAAGFIVWSLVQSYPKSMMLPGLAMGWFTIPISRLVVRWIRRSN